MVAQPVPVQVFKYGEGVRPDTRQEGVGGSVEELDRRHVRLEVAVSHQFIGCLSIRHECAGSSLAPQAVGVPDAVGAVQRAILDVVQAQAALSVLDHLTGTLR